MELTVDWMVNNFAMNNVTDTRQRLVDSARDLITSRSYGDVGVQEICEHAGVRKGSFYHFFASKRELTLAAIDDSLVVYKEQLLAAAFAPDLAPMARFYRLVEMVHVYQKDAWKATGALPGCPFGNLASEMSTQDEVMRARLAVIFGLLREPFERNLEAAVDAGELPTIDIRATAESMLAYMEGVMLMAKTQNDPELLLRLGPAVTRLCFPVADKLA